MVTSHEINTPLGILLTSSSYLNDRILNDALTKNMLLKGMKLVNSSVNKMSVIMSRIKEIKIEDDMFVKTSFDLKNMLSVVFNEKKIRYTCIEKRIVWKGLEDYIIFSNQLIWKKIVDEILDNVCLYNQNDNELVIELKKEDNRLILKFITHKSAISDKDSTLIFYPFYTTKREDSKHIGLGLHLVNSLVESIFNGKFFLESIDSPLVFTIDIPET